MFFFSVSLKTNGLRPEIIKPVRIFCKRRKHATVPVILAVRFLFFLLIDQQITTQPMHRSRSYVFLFLIVVLLSSSCGKKSPRVLIFSKTKGWVHGSIPFGIA